MFAGEWALVSMNQYHCHSCLQGIQSLPLIVILPHKMQVQAFSSRHNGWHNIILYHHFRMHKDNPGVVYVKEHANSPEKAIHPFKLRVPSDQMPDEIIPPGINAQRQWYLYEQIR